MSLSKRKRDDVALFFYIALYCGKYQLFLLAAGAAAVLVGGGGWGALIVSATLSLTAGVLIAKWEKPSTSVTAAAMIGVVSFVVCLFGIDVQIALLTAAMLICHFVMYDYEEDVFIAGNLMGPYFAGMLVLSIVLFTAAAAEGWTMPRLLGAGLVFTLAIAGALTSYFIASPKWQYKG